MGIGLVCALLVGLYVLSRLVGAGIRRTGRTGRRMGRLTMYSRLALIGIGVYFTVALYSMFAPFDSAATGLEFEPLQLGTVLGTGFGFGVVVFGVVLAVHRAIAPTIRDVMERRHTVPAHSRRRYWVSVAVVSIGASMALILVLTTQLAVFWYLVVITPIVYCWLLLRLPVVSGACRTRDPTVPERSRLEGCFERLDRELPGIIVFDDEAEDLAAKLVGTNAVRTLYVQASLLADTTDDELAAVIAAEAEKNRRYFYQRYVLVYLAWCACLVTMVVIVAQVITVLALNGDPDTPLAWVALAGVSIVSMFGGNRLVRRTIYPADRAATSVVDPDVVRRVYDRYAETITVVDQEQTREDPNRKLAVEPPMADRIRRIEREHDLEPMELSHVADERTEGDSVDRDSGWHTSTRVAIGRRLAAMDATAFAQFVATFRSEWGRACTVTEAAEDWIDVVATREDGTHELLRTVHRPSDEPVTADELTSERGRIECDTTVETVLVITTGRIDESVEALPSDPTVVDGQRLVELIEDADLEDELAATPA
ncbi:hypothetical protein D8Y22_04390 [Salinadaptatus halalkaliphilus]|uniref:Uncharacterized protein n=2 Tax=Salinadaptatus halalkaliphilus TaxID=2419781 RepID=A0A4S3TS27_9EURY|nr:hypothetical protein D8Y22_04390 [Salinadaptatus halalkaliphilus]